MSITRDHITSLNLGTFSAHAGHTAFRAGEPQATSSFHFFSPAIRTGVERSFVFFPRTPAGQPFGLRPLGQFLRVRLNAGIDVFVALLRGLGDAGGGFNDCSDERVVFRL